MARPFARSAAFATLASCAALGMASDRHTLEDSIPPGARGAVLAFSGEVRAIAGLASGVAGRVDPVAAALQELGARTTEQEIRIEMSADVLFDFDRAELKPEAEASLQKVGTVLRAYGRSQVTVEGHTDAKGSDTYNQRLSERRAAAVVSWLSARAGLGGGRLTARGLGAQRPVASNARADGSDDPEGRRRNRRVEIVVRKAG
jgi:outer membrane protein OmpA-like peptidoglycan-associated protein